LEELARHEVEDVYLDPSQTPSQFWEVVIQATDWHLLKTNSNNRDWEEWGREIRWEFGWGSFARRPNDVYVDLLRDGLVPLSAPSTTLNADLGARLSAVEHLLDVMSSEQSREFENAVNERARWFRVGLRIEDRRFLPVASEHIHDEVVRPTLVLLSMEVLADVDALYRKAFNRALSGDPSGAITVSVSAVEELLRVGLGVTGHNLNDLAKKARQSDWVSPAVEQFIVKLSALRPDSDAHARGSSQNDVAMLALHVAASILLHLAKTGPFIGTQ
jgi:hypothetical protein